jgi:fibro-slime domain-containing protein
MVTGEMTTARPASTMAILVLLLGSAGCSHGAKGTQQGSGGAGGSTLAQTDAGPATDGPMAQDLPYANETAKQTGGAQGGGGAGTGGGAGQGGSGGQVTGGTSGTQTGGAAGGAGSGGSAGAGGGAGSGGSAKAGGSTGTGGGAGSGGGAGTGASAGSGGTGGGGNAACGNGKTESGEQCDCGRDAANLPSGCAGPNGVFFGDGKGCAPTCTKEPSCLDASGKTRACTPVCGDGNQDPDEACDDGNRLDGDGCSSTCTRERGFACEPQPFADSSPCQSGGGECLHLPVIYRDFLPENVAGGHPDFYWPGTKNGSGAITTWCVPDASGPTRARDATARCWGIVADALSGGKPQPGGTKTCKCRFTDWNVGNSVEHIGGHYDKSDSPLASGTGYRSDVTMYTYDTKSIPIWEGTLPAYQDDASLKQWWNDVPQVNQTFTALLELASLGGNVYQYESKVHKLDGDFLPLDALNPAQKTLCNLSPYWNEKFFPGCVGDQYLFPPRLKSQSDCPAGDSYEDGCWLPQLAGQPHDYYFTYELRTYFAYDDDAGLTVQASGTDDIFVFVNGVLVLDLGGTHSSYPGKVTIAGAGGAASITEGGCLDSNGNIVGAEVGSYACCPLSGSGIKAVTPDDLRLRKIDGLGLETGKLYELAIFGANRHPTDSLLDLRLGGLTMKRSVCVPSP